MALVDFQMEGFFALAPIFQGGYVLFNLLVLKERSGRSVIIVLTRYRIGQVRDIEEGGR